MPQLNKHVVMPSLTHGSLFSGIGGFDLASEWMGWENVFHCEWNDFGKRILKYYWPNATSYDDITKTDFSIWRGRIDVLTGGFPCQPYSVAGKRKGKEDERHLWPEMLRAIREIQPRYVVGENVRGLTNWNGGLVFDEVQADLENEGYEVLPFLLPAGSVNAPHRRDRIWFVAFKNSNENGRGSDEREKEPSFRKQRDTCAGNNERIPTNNDKIGVASNPESQQSKRMQFKQREVSEQEQREFRGSDSQNDVANSNGRRQSSEKYRETKSGQFAKESFSGYWENFPTQSPVCNGNDGIPSELDGITFPKWRNESIKAGGNAIVPQVALQILKAIQAHEVMLSEA